MLPLIEASIHIPNLSCHRDVGAHMVDSQERYLLNTDSEK